MPATSHALTHADRPRFRLKLAPVTDPSTRALLHNTRARKDIDEWVGKGCLDPCPRPLLSYAEALGRVDHPHEAVAVDLIRFRLYKFSDEAGDVGDDRAHQDVWTRLRLRAAEQAATEGVHWTPLLDAMAERIAFLDGCNLDPVLEPLLTWIDQQQDYRRIRPLTHARYHILRHRATLRLFQLAPAVPDAESLVEERYLFQALNGTADLPSKCRKRLAATAIDLVLGDLAAVRKSHPCRPCDEQDGLEMLAWMGRRGTLPASAYRDLLDVALDRRPPNALRGAATTMVCGPQSPNRPQRARDALADLVRWVPVPILEEWFHYRWAEPPHEVSSGIIVMRPDLPLDLRRLIMRHAGPLFDDDDWRSVAKASDPHHDRELRDDVFAFADVASIVALADPTPEEWRRIFSAAGATPSVYDRLAQNLSSASDADLAGLSDADWQPIVAALNSERDRLPAARVLAEIPNARSNSAIRAQLLDVDDTCVLEVLCLDATGAEVPGLFRRLARVDPERALAVLDDAPDLVPHLGRHDLTPLTKLEGEDVQARVFGHLMKVKLNRDLGTASN